MPERGGSDTTATRGDVRTAVSKLTRTGECLVGRASKLAIIDDAWANPKTSIGRIVAPVVLARCQALEPIESSRDCDFQSLAAAFQEADALTGTLEARKAWRIN